MLPSALQPRFFRGILTGDKSDLAMVPVFLLPVSSVGSLIGAVDAIAATLGIAPPEPN